MSDFKSMDEKQMIALLDAGARTLPRRQFRNGDQDQTWALASDGLPRWMQSCIQHDDGTLGAMNEWRWTAKFVPRYQSGWEGCGVWAHATCLPDAPGGEVAEQLLLDAGRRISRDTTAVRILHTTSRTG